jgi:glycerophosphoryl diester phosphodiesterase
MKTITQILLFSLLFGLTSCIDDGKLLSDDELDPEQASVNVVMSQLSSQQLDVQAYVKERPIIAHRGTQEYAPENTAASYRFARQVGADYIQIDLQMTSDRFLVGFRNDLNNHSDIATEFPGFQNAGVNHFTLAELKRLDVGTSYENATYDRVGYHGLKILTIEEVINICEGKLPDGSVDPADNGNRPGIYIRFYQPWLNPDMEEVLKAELTRLGWYNDNLDNLKVIPTFTDKVAVANTKGRVFLSTLEKTSLLKLETVFQGKLPLGFWLWKSSNYISDDTAQTYGDHVNYGIEHGAQFIAPNTSTNDLLHPWQAALIRRTNARIQGYTINTKANMAQYTYNELPIAQGNIYQLDVDLSDGFITNRPQYAAFFYGRYYLGPELIPNPPFLSSTDIKNVFISLGYN